MTVLVQGLLAGAAHVLTGPDHLAGVAPLAVERRPSLRPSIIGAWWGLGHGLGVAILGVLGQTLLQLTEIEIASRWAERLVGVVLVAIGIIAVRRARALTVHAHVHSHGEGTHAHLHVHDHQHDHGDEHQGDRPRHRHRHAAFGVGVIHGLAGAGHFWAVLPSLAMPPASAALYIGSYLGASILIMMLFGAALGRIVIAFGERAVPKLMTAVGIASIAIGLGWLLVGFDVL